MYCSYSNYLKKHISGSTENLGVSEQLWAERVFRSETEKAKTTIEFCFFQLVKLQISPSSDNFDVLLQIFRRNLKLKK